MDRKYSISEIDRMRGAIAATLEVDNPSSYSQQERNADTENRLRTYMQNGTDPDELEKMMYEALDREFEAARIDRTELTVPSPVPSPEMGETVVIDLPDGRIVGKVIGVFHGEPTNTSSAGS